MSAPPRIEARRHCNGCTFQAVGRTPIEAFEAVDAASGEHVRSLLEDEPDSVIARAIAADAWVPVVMEP
jgi:hypothetical protein